MIVAAAVAAASVTSGLASPAGAAPGNGQRSCNVSSAATYVVVDGDNWSAISKMVGVRMPSLVDANAATAGTAIHPGDTLCLPADAVPPSTVAPTTGSSCASSSPGTYRVVDGDGWFAIARKAGVEMQQMLDANGVTAEHVLHIGDALCLPKGAAAGAAGSTQKAAARIEVSLDVLPLQGPCWYADSWRAARGNGRRHEGVDLIAEAGKYVYAVVDGILTQRAWDQPGRLAGNAWWLTAVDGSNTYFFYAHLYDFAPGLKAGSQVKAGQIIGFVGETGSAATAHLHFEVHPGGGDPVNAYPIARAAGGCNRGAPYRQPGGWAPDTTGIAVD